MTLLKFKMDCIIQADKWKDDKEKQIYMENAEDIMNKAMFMVGTADWKVIVKDAEVMKDDNGE